MVEKQKTNNITHLTTLNITVILQPKLYRTNKEQNDFYIQANVVAQVSANNIEKRLACSGVRKIPEQHLRYKKNILYYTRNLKNMQNLFRSLLTQNN